MRSEVTMKALAIVCNIFIPGVGSFFVGQVGQGIAQIILYGLGFLITIGTLGIGAIIGIPMMIGAWIWGLITAFGVNQQPVQVNIVNNASDGTIEKK